ncbi:amidohydrolase family protein [Ruicaihuangia caeni]|uniref:2-amino-3-carboxymuconate-6-semialdehyde decarboxylase n=1 Tax=Ruicaihuangia caeni TaxID=3042517 RepID=A0AAW6TCD3_9MICO|nr:amidohydrolase family protein [Klugiella sp. YN-L-19]MDI2099030.1 amidohydrolase family protein [Klugiella sp. YN-L-19]
MQTTTPTIDVHTHYVPKGWPDLEEATGGTGPWPWLRVENEREAMIMVGSSEFRPLSANAWHADERLEQMDADGIDIQVVSPTPLFFSYARDAGEATRVAKIFNDLALEICEPAGDRLVPFAQVPLQDTDAACRELDRCIDNGHRGVEIGNHVGDRDLDDDAIVTFLQHCADRDVPVFVHPWDMPNTVRTNRWMAQWLVGMPAETHLSILSLVLGGGFDRLPESLRICFAHGGGSFPYWVGRMDNAWRGRPDLVATSEHPPSHYLDRFSVDSVVFSEPALRLLVDTMGAERIMLGSDYPYPLGEQPSGRLIRTAEFLTEREREAVLSRNAVKFLGLDLAHDVERAHGARELVPGGEELTRWS